MVAIAEGPLIIRPRFPFDLLFLPESYGLEYEVPVSHVGRIEHSRSDCVDIEPSGVKPAESEQNPGEEHDQQPHARPLPGRLWPRARRQAGDHHHHHESDEDESQQIERVPLSNRRRTEPQRSNRRRIASTKVATRPQFGTL